MALGFYRDDVNGHRVIAHGGDTVYMHSNLDLFIDDNVGIFISMNSDGKAGSPRWLREALLARFADRYFPAELEGTPIDAKTAREHAQMLAGTYASSRGFATNFMSLLDLVGQEKVGVDENGGILVGSAANAAGQPRKWIEVAPFVWRDRDSGMRLAAKVEDGKVTEWRFDTISAIMTFHRVPWYKDTAWLLPAFLGALGMVLLSAVAWPAGAIARRRYKAAAPPRRPQAACPARASRVAMAGAGAAGGVDHLVLRRDEQPLDAERPARPAALRAADPQPDPPVRPARAGRMEPVDRAQGEARLVRAADRRQAVGEGQHVMVFGALAHLPEARVIAVLLAATRIAAGGLDMTVGLRADPHICPGRGNGKRLDALEGRSIRFAALYGFIPKSLA